MSENGKSAVPSELRLTHKWDVAVERLIINAGIGFATAGLASIVIFRKPSARYALTSLGLGWGIGSAWTLNSIDFAKERADKSASSSS